MDLCDAGEWLQLGVGMRAQAKYQGWTLTAQGMASVQSHSTEGRNSGRTWAQRVRKLLLEGKALGCFREGTMCLCCTLFRFCNQNFIGEIFFYVKYGHTLGNAQNVRACHSIFRGSLCASECTGRVRPKNKGNIKAYSWGWDADAVGSQAVASGSPSFQRRSFRP